MSICLKKNIPMLKLLCGAKPAVIRAVLKGASPDLIRALSECSLNLLKGHIPLTSNQMRQLRRHKQSVRLLAKKKTSLKRRKQLLQKGGFLGALVKPLLGVLGGLLTQ